MILLILKITHQLTVPIAFAKSVCYDLCPSVFQLNELDEEWFLNGWQFVAVFRFKRNLTFIVLFGCPLLLGGKMDFIVPILQMTKNCRLREMQRTAGGVRDGAWVWDLGLLSLDFQRLPYFEVDSPGIFLLICMVPF